MALPGIIPRLKTLVTSGFGSLAYLMAIIYYSVRLLPPGHPYVNPANIGHFGVRHVVAQAANNLVLKKENIDQIIIFVALLIGFILLILQFVLLINLFIFAPAFAAPPPPTDFGGLFKTMKPELDIAFMMLDSVFGVPDLFNSCVSMGTSCGPASPVGVGIRPAGAATTSPFHNGLHDLFLFYNTAILIVGVLIFLYYIVITVAETAQSGSPFGRRFNHIWAPLRLVTALGLLVPLNYGLNSAQYITLFAARMGSGFATNGWLLFNRALDDSLDGSGLSMVAKPAPPQVDHIWQFLALAKSCQHAYQTLGKLREVDGGSGFMIGEINPYLVKVGYPAQMADGIWENATNFYNKGDIIIVFGEENASKYKDLPGYVFPWCGQIVITTQDFGFDATKHLQGNFYLWILEMWYTGIYDDYADQANCVSIGDKPFPGCPAATRLKDDVWKEERSAAEFTNVKTYITDAWTEMKGEVNNKRLASGILDRGWGGAGLWYNEIARWNGAMFAAAKTLPTVSKMPAVMEDIREARRGHDRNTNAMELFEPFLGGHNPVEYHFKTEEKIAKMLSNVYIDLRKNASNRPETQPSGNVFYDMLNMVFGIDGLFDLRKNQDVHPMAALVAAGKSIIDASIRNLMVSLAFAVGGGATEAMELHLGGGLGSISAMFASFATLGISIGFMLYYILPFLPFIYFFFGIGTWVKTVFEAMVGVPLWALAHLRVDGNGLPGDTAMNGYFLIFEIFVRPILIVFGLIASVLIFSAMTTTLNGIFDLVTSNLTGFDCNRDDLSILSIGTGCEEATGFKRAIVDEFFFTVIYALLVYLIGTSCFKLIDQIPSDILRWMGAGVRTFNNLDGDPTGNLLRYTGAGSNMMTQQIVPALQQGATVTGQAVGTGVSMVENLATRSAPFRATGAPGPGGPAGGGGGTP